MKVIASLALVIFSFSLLCGAQNQPLCRAIVANELQVTHPALYGKIEQLSEPTQNFRPKNGVRELLAEFANQMGGPQFVKAVTLVFDRRQDLDLWKEYMLKLQEEAATEVINAGGEAQEILLQTNQIPRQALLAVLTKRAISRGEIIGEVKKVISDHAFMEVVRRGPFLDHAFDLDAQMKATNSHGVDTHFVQRDFDFEAIYSVYGNKYQLFYDIITTRFDVFKLLSDSQNPDGTSPERIRAAFLEGRGFD